MALAGLCVVPACCGCVLLLGSLSDRAVNRCFFWGCALLSAAFAGVGAVLPPWHREPPVPWGGN